MNKFDIEKNKALKVNNALKQTAASGRFGQGAVTVADRRTQRKLDQEKGLVPFACKLDDHLIKQLQARAATHEGGMSAVLAELLIAAGLEARPVV